MYSPKIKSPIFSSSLDENPKSFLSSEINTLAISIACKPDPIIIDDEVLSVFFLLF